MIVEEFRPEINSQGEFVLRHWYFLGSKEFCRTLVSQNAIVKWSNMSDDEKQKSRQEWTQIRVEENADIPEELRAVRKLMSLDFGRIDWAISEGKPVVYDVNKTPSDVGQSTGDRRLDMMIEDVVRSFAKGIEDVISK